jgi:hypothetical protein
MIGMDSYLDAYVDRRMKLIVDEWDLSTRADLTEFSGRLAALEQEIPRLRTFEQEASDKLAALEKRAEKLKGRV